MPKVQYTDAKGLHQVTGTGLTFARADGTASSAAVTVNGRSGIITSESISVSAGATSQIDVTNSLVTADSIVIANICDATYNENGSEGILNCQVDAVSAGSFVINLTNDGADNVSSKVVKVAYLVLS